MSDTQLRMLLHYRAQLLAAWRCYRAEVARGTDKTAAELISLRAVYPSGQEDVAEILSLWREHRLWPLFNPADSDFDTDPDDSVELDDDVEDLLADPYTAAPHPRR